MRACVCVCLQGGVSVTRAARCVVMHGNVWTHTYTHAHTHTHMLTHIHTCTHTYTHVLVHKRRRTDTHVGPYVSGIRQQEQCMTYQLRLKANWNDEGDTSNSFSHLHLFTMSSWCHCPHPYMRLFHSTHPIHQYSIPRGVWSVWSGRSAWSVCRVFGVCVWTAGTNTPSDEGAGEGYGHKHSSLTHPMDQNGSIGLQYWYIVR